MCDAFKKEYGGFISEIEKDVIQSNDSVCYSETWLCEKATSVVVGFDENDEIVIQEN